MSRQSDSPPSQVLQDLAQFLFMYDGLLEHSPRAAQYEQYLLLSEQLGIGGVGIVVVVVVVMLQ